jgi:type II secretory ATPase GspE/PulE/Tfp pilus assembly ATPase PilB-like protein
MNSNTAHTPSHSEACHSIPESLKKRVLVQGGKILVSGEVEEADPHLLSFLSYAGRKGIKDVERLPAQKFIKVYRANLEVGRSDSDLVNMAVKLMQEAYDLGASDIHIAEHGPFATIEIRRLGMIQPLRQYTGDIGRRLITVIYQTMSTSADSNFSENKRQDGRIIDRKYLPHAVTSVRIHTEPLDCDFGGYGTGVFMALRLLYDRTKADGELTQRLTTLGYSQRHIRRFQFLTQRSGLTLLSGPTGHGKSTALKHIMECMATTWQTKNFMSIEDPPEYPLERVKQIRVSSDYAEPEKRGREYRNAIAGAMRSDPDTLMVGEIRYPEAAAAALDAAQTGHGVWSTVHANSAFGIVQRMVSLLRAAQYPDPLEYLCDHTVLAGLVHQRLVPVLCPECKQPLKEVAALPLENEYRQKVMPEPVLSRLFRTIDPDKMEFVHVRGEGCSHCDGMGIIGQTVAAEVVATDHLILRYLRRNLLQKAYKHWREEQNGQTFVGHAIELVEQGTIDPHLTELRLGVPLNYAKAVEDFNLPAKELDELAGTAPADLTGGY